jgi:hypothetical protein
MLNPWFSFSFETARRGWEAQGALVFGLMRLFEAGVSGQTGGGHAIKEKGDAAAGVQGDTTPIAIERDTGHKEAEKGNEVIEVHGHTPSAAGGRDDAHKKTKKDSKVRKSPMHTQRPPERAPKRSMAARHTGPSAVVGPPSRKGR